MRFFLAVLTLVMASASAHAAYENKPFARLRWLDKVTAQTEIVDLPIGDTAHYGDLSIRVRACRQQDPLEGAENAAFLQIWEKDQTGEPQWVYSGWMFATSPGLAAMDHPIYDVWVLECRDHAGDDAPKPSAAVATVTKINADKDAPKEDVESSAKEDVQKDVEQDSETHAGQSDGGTE